MTKDHKIKPRQYHKDGQKWLPVYDNWVDGWTPIPVKKAEDREEGEG